jgi:Membrane proteins related to metalloendopeptidases
MLRPLFCYLGSAKSDPTLKAREEYYGYRLMQIPLKTKAITECPVCGEAYLNDDGTCWFCDGFIIEECTVIGNGGNSFFVYCPICSGMIHPSDLCICGGGNGNTGGNGPGGGQQIMHHRVDLYANPATGGSVSGEGDYVSGASVSISAWASSGYKFERWTGSATSSSTPYIFNIFDEMSFTANFRPCFGTNKANPLPYMKLQPPPGSQPIAATFGNTRKKDTATKRHDGIDLYGAVGTPIYAQFDGVIASSPYVNNQVNRLANGKYPSNYTGNTNDAGNRIYIISTVEGNSVKMGYWHLQEGTPFGTNPATNQPWAKGDAIQAGQIIGYIGVTGNSDPNVPHLHLQAYKNGALINPASYLNATITTTTTTITTPCD